MPNATQLSSWVVSAVWTQSQLVGDSFDESEQICQHRSEVALCRRCERTCRHSSPDQVYNFLCCWAIEVGDKWWHNDVIVEKNLSISIKIHVVKLLCSVYKLSTESVSSRHELVANCVHTYRRRDLTVASRRRCVLGMGFTCFWCIEAIKIIMSDWPRLSMVWH